jgi:hypothetical protein
MSDDLVVDVDTLRSQVREKYRDVANDRHAQRTGRRRATRARAMNANPDDDDDGEDDDLLKASAPPGPPPRCRRCGRWRGGRCGWGRG